MYSMNPFFEARPKLHLNCDANIFTFQFSQVGLLYVFFRCSGLRLDLLRRRLPHHLRHFVGVLVVLHGHSGALLYRLGCRLWLVDHVVRVCAQRVSFVPALRWALLPRGSGDPEYFVPRDFAKTRFCFGSCATPSSTSLILFLFFL